jgi:hypothetical protein
VDPEPELLDATPVRLPRADGPPPGDETARPTTGSSVRHRWGRWVAVALVVSASGALVYADGQERRQESAALSVCQTRLRIASAEADYRMGLTTNYVLPIVTDGGSTHLADIMAPRAREVLPAVQRADRQCQSVRVRPWHFGLAAKQQAATAYSGALVTLLQLVAAQGRHDFHGDPTLQHLRNAAGVDDG